MSSSLNSALCKIVEPQYIIQLYDVSLSRLVKVMLYAIHYMRRSSGNRIHYFKLSPHTLQCQSQLEIIGAEKRGPAYL